MPKRLTVALVAVLAVALVAAAAVVGVRWWRDAHRTTFEQATAYAPADAERLSWTDWAAVRSKVGADLDADSSAADLRTFLDQGYDADLTSASALVESAPVLQTHFGFSPASATWELFSQGKAGAVVFIKMPDGTDYDAIADRLRDDGFDEPSSEDGVWDGVSALPSIGSDLTPELQFVALDRDDGMVITSDTGPYLTKIVSGLGDGDLPDPVQGVISGSGEPLSAAVYDGDYTCSALAMSQADSDDQATADRLIAEAGKVNPVAGFAMSVQPGGHVRVVLAFENADQARTNADSRAQLASGPAPGQGGDFSDRFSVGSATADGDLVTLDLEPHPDNYVFSDLSSGPLLFATC
ncbi:hypothetical protein ABLE68_10780 [Nocardioides sp. CN2-186]|uniref:hypothetical protein n=1 Tax=Nocardioides tweenelious TaxID=3156607 RepID=UPI0032B56FBA